MIITIAMLFGKKGIFITEIAIAILSYFVLSYFGKAYLYVFTVRAITYINLYFVVSELVDKSTVLDALGEKGVPIIIALAYYPYFFQLSSEVSFYARARGMGFNPIKISRPLLVEMIKVAENLYVAYTVKLFGKYSGKRNLKPRTSDIILLAVGFAVLTMSIIFPL
ncbi:hypothetical protein [Acidianus sp. HS-5]|uniref:hypothetical protein n=1 Tax=Acidianus sp. HS-5 TaxID=2886040 RepID=UPI001F170639|nr:hypothetical protein [Acidianus sp. HS-5]